MYKVVEASEKRGIVYEVNILMDQGWVPLGGICVLTVLPPDTWNTTRYYQAMIKKEE